MNASRAIDLNGCTVVVACFLFVFSFSPSSSASSRLLLVDMCQHQKRVWLRDSEHPSTMNYSLIIDSLLICCRFSRLGGGAWQYEFSLYLFACCCCCCLLLLLYSFIYCRIEAVGWREARRKRCVIECGSTSSTRYDERPIRPRPIKHTSATTFASIASPLERAQLLNLWLRKG